MVGEVRAAPDVDPVALAILLPYELLNRVQQQPVHDFSPSFAQLLVPPALIRRACALNTEGGAEFKGQTHDSLLTQHKTLGRR